MNIYSLVGVRMCVLLKAIQRFPSPVSLLRAVRLLSDLPYSPDRTVGIRPGCKDPVLPLHVRPCWIQSLRKGTDAGKKTQEGETVTNLVTMESWMRSTRSKVGQAQCGQTGEQASQPGLR